MMELTRLTTPLQGEFFSLVVAYDAITMMNTLTYFDIDEKSKCGYGTEIIKYDYLRNDRLSE